MKKIYSLFAFVAFTAASFAQASLPFTFTGGSAAIPSTTGLTQTGLGSDYGGSNVTTKLKFDNTNDELVLNYSGVAVQLVFDIKHNKGADNWENTTNLFEVYESVDGTNFTNVIFTSNNTTNILPNTTPATFYINTINSNSRYIKWIYTLKGQGNVGLGNIRLNDAANVLSVKDNNIAGLSVYPNPANTIVNISSDLNEVKNVEIFDILGKQVMKASTELSLNVSTLKTGVYMMKITQDGKTASRKLVIK